MESIRDKTAGGQYGDLVWFEDCGGLFVEITLEVKSELLMANNHESVFYS